MCDYYAWCNPLHLQGVDPTNVETNCARLRVNKFTMVFRGVDFLPRFTSSHGQNVAPRESATNERPTSRPGVRPTFMQLSVSSHRAFSSRIGRSFEVSIPSALTLSLPRVINFKIPHAASLEILHHKVWGTWLLIAHSDWKMIIMTILTTLLIHFPIKGWENVLFELGSERVNPGWSEALFYFLQLTSGQISTKPLRRLSDTHVSDSDHTTGECTRTTSNSATATGKSWF